MKIAVCIKRTPVMDVRFQIAASGQSIDETGLKYDISDFDGYAVEVALKLWEKDKQGEIVAISLGPDVVQESIRKALSMGVHRGIHLKADRVPVDGLAIAHALAAELEGGGYDLVLFGRIALDTASGAVGPMTAARLGVPCVAAISKLEIANGRANVRRELEGAAETLEVPLPCVLTIDEGIARPRLPTLPGIMAAKKKPLEVKPAQLGTERLTVVSVELPPERSGGRIVGEGAAAVPELVRLLQTEAKVL